MWERPVWVGTARVGTAAPGCPSSAARLLSKTRPRSLFLNPLGVVLLKPHPQGYFAASCAHFASVFRKG